MYKYSIHGMISVDSNEPLQRLTPFASDAAAASRVVVHLGAFKPNLEGYRKIIKTHVSERGVYCEDHYKTLSYRLWVTGIDDEVMHIHFDSGHPMSREIFYVLILEPLLTYRFALNGVLLMHASALTVDGKGILISGSTGVGKTTTLLNLLGIPGAMYFSDDQSIVKDGVLYSYPMPIGMRLRHLVNSSVSLPASDLIRVVGHAALNTVTGYYGNFTHRVPPDHLLYRGNVVKTGTVTPLRCVVLLNIDSPPMMKRAPRLAAFESLLAHNRRNEDKQRLVSRLFAKYSLVNPPFNYWERYREMLYDLVNRDIDFYEVRIEKKYGVQDAVKMVTEAIRGD
jgi:hypothetical protein